MYTSQVKDEAPEHSEACFRRDPFREKKQIGTNALRQQGDGRPSGERGRPTRQAH